MKRRKSRNLSFPLNVCNWWVAKYTLLRPIDASVAETYFRIDQTTSKRYKAECLSANSTVDPVCLFSNSVPNFMHKWEVLWSHFICYHHCHKHYYGCVLCRLKPNLMKQHLFEHIYAICYLFIFRNLTIKRLGNLHNIQTTTPPPLWEPFPKLKHICGGGEGWDDPISLA